MEYDYKKLFEYVTKCLLSCPQCPKIKECHSVKSKATLLCDQPNFWEEVLLKEM